MTFLAPNNPMLLGYVKYNETNKLTNKEGMAIPPWLGYILCAVAGVLLATQPSTTSALAKYSFSSFAALISFLTGLIVVTVYFLIEFISGNLEITNISNVPWWAWSGGIVGAFYIICISILTKDLGATVLFGIIVAAQATVALLIDHFGWLEMPVRSINWGRGIGTLLIIVGTITLTIFTKN